MTRVGVFGAAGRLGAAVCRAVADDVALDLVAAVDPSHTGSEVAGMTISAERAVMADAGVEVAVDFTRVDAARENIMWAAERGIHMVVGTTGFGPDDHQRFAEVFTTTGCIVAPNFAIGAVLMMRFAELAAPYFDSAEIVELHHDRKRDAPSGTAMLTAQLMAAASDDWGADPTEHEVLDGARGGRGPGGIRVHSVRLRGLVAHQEVVLGTAGQSLTIRHDSYDVSCFMPGVLLAVKAVADRPGLTIGLDPLLGPSA